MSRLHSWTMAALLGTSALSAVPALAAEVKGTSRIEAVVVFPQGAEITRTAKVRLEAGEHSVLLNDLPGQAIASSVRVEGKSTGKLEVGSVDIKRTYITSTDTAAVPANRKRLEDEIEQQKDLRAAQDDIIRGAEAQKAFLDNLAKLPSTPASTLSTGQREDWGQIFNVIGTRSTEAAKAITEAKLKQREIDKKLVDLQKELASTAPKQIERTELRINAAADAPLEATLTLRYQVPSASWQAFYDARLSSGDKTTAPKLQIARRAAVTNTTGEDWEDIALSLSTTRPGRATAAPDLNMLSVDFEQPMPVAVPAAPAPVAGVADGMAARSAMPRAKLATEPASKAAEVKEEAASEAVAETSATAFQTVFAIPGKATVKTQSEVKRVLIEQLAVDPQLVVRTVPRLDTTAYLYARTMWPKDRAPAMPGAVALFRDGVFVGNGRMAQLAPGEEAELGFGADDRVKVKRNVTEDKKGETGTFSTSKVEERNFTIEVKNLHQRAVQVGVLDRVPVSMQKDISVDVTIKGPQPTKRDVQGRRGVNIWDMKLEPDEEKTVAFGYKVTYPPDKRVMFRELTPEQIRQQNVTRF